MLKKFDLQTQLEFTKFSIYKTGERLTRNNAHFLFSGSQIGFVAGCLILETLCGYSRLSY